MIIVHHNKHNLIAPHYPLDFIVDSSEAWLGIMAKLLTLLPHSNKVLCGGSPCVWAGFLWVLWLGLGPVALKDGSNAGYKCWEQIEVYFNQYKCNLHYWLWQL